MTTTPPKRRNISLKKQLEAALLQLGFEPTECELDHDPALGLRRVDLETGETDPKHDDPRYLVWRPKAEHKQKTTGRRGESRLSKRGGDISAIAKVERIEADVIDFRKRLLSKGDDLADEVGEGVVARKGQKFKKAWPSRPFPKRQKEPKPLNRRSS